MSQEIINLGTGPDSGDGDSLYVAFTKVNDNFTQVWEAGPVGSNIVIANNTILSADVNGNIIISPNGVGYVILDNNTIPEYNNLYFLGDATRRWRGLFVGDVGINVTGNISAGNVTVSGSTDFTGNVSVGNSLTVNGEISSIGNINGPNLNLEGNLYANSGTFSGNVDVLGNLQVSGNVIFIDVDELRIHDPIIELGAGANGGPLVINDGYSRGLQLDYFDTSAKYGFFGLAGNNYTTYEFLIDATGVANSYTGTPANLYFGNASVTGAITTASLSTNDANVSGTLVVGTTANIANINSSGTTRLNLVEVQGPLTGNGNITGRNFRTTGLVTATGNVTGGNLLTGGIVSSVGNVTTDSNLVATGNVVAGNVVTIGQISAAGNISAQYYFGDGGYLSNIAAGNISNLNLGKISNGYSNVSIDQPNSNVTISVFGTTNVAVFSNTGAYIDGLISATGSITGDNITVIGNANVGAILTDNYFYANGAPVDFQQPAGSNTWVQYNDNDSFGGSAAFTFDSSANLLVVNGTISSTGNVVSDGVVANLVDATAVTAVGNIAGGNIITGGLVSATGNVVGGNLRTTGAVVGGTGSFLSDVTIYGNLQVGGNIVYVDVKELRVTDPVIELGGGPNGAPLTSNDGFSRGLKLDYFSDVANTEQFGFVGLAATDYNTYQFLTNATDVGNTFTGTAANLYFGNAQATGNISANGVLTDNYYYANGAPVDWQQPAGSNNWIQYNDNDSFGASANLTFDSANNILGVAGNISTDNLSANGVYTTNLVSTNAQVTTISASGNVDAGNLLTSGIVSSTGNITGANVIGGNLFTNGNVSAAGNIYGATLIGNIQGTISSDSINVTGNVDAGNLRTTGEITATGNIIGGNIISTGNAAVSGILTDNYFYANGAPVDFQQPAGSNTQIQFNNDSDFGASANLTFNTETNTLSVIGNVFGSNVNAGYLNSGPADFTGNVNIVGDLNVDGNVTYINVNDLRVEDPIIDMGGGPNGAPLTTNDGFSRGLKLEYFNTTSNAPQFGFMGLAASDYTTYQLLINATDAGNTFTGTAANLYLGNLSATGNAAVGGILTDNYFYANGAPVDFQQPAGSNTWIQFNNNNDFGASANLTFDSNINQFYVNGTGSFVGNITGGNLRTAGVITATGNIDGGNLSGENIIGTLSTNAQPNINSVGTLISLNSGVISSSGNVTGTNLLTGGSVSAAGNVTGDIVNANIVNTGTLSTTGNAQIGGDLFINGNVTYINITDLNVQDPIIGLGRGANNTPLTINDGKDRGEQLWYYTTSEKSAFIGWDNSTDNLIAAVDVTNNNEIIAVNNWGNLVVGNLYTQALNSANSLFVNAEFGVVTIGNSTVTTGATFAVNTTDSMLIPSGNTFQRPESPVVGMVRFNTTLDAFEYYSDVDGWTVGGGAVAGNITSQTFTADGITVSYTLTTSSTTVDSMVSINGITQVPIAAYSIVGTTLTFTEPPDAGDTIEVREIAAQATVHAITNSSGNASVSVNDAAAQVNIVGDIIPDANVTYNLGSPTKQWNDLYLSGNTIYIGGNSLSVANGNLTFNGNISGQYIYGNGAFLTGISGGGNATLAGNLVGNLEGNGFGANAFTFVSATGNITSGNLRTSGSISAAGNLTSGNISTGIISASGNVTAQNFIGNISITGNVTGTSPNVQLVAGAYTSTFDNTGNVSLANGTVSLTTLSAAGNITGANIIAGGNIVTQGGGVINKASGFVNAGTFVTLDNIKATVTTSGNRSLALAAVTGSFSVYVSGVYTLFNGGTAGTGATYTVTTSTGNTTAIAWNFTAQGDTVIYIVNDTTNSRAYRIVLMIGGSYNNNLISIERL